MTDKLIEFLQTIMGKTICGLVLFFILGVIAVGYSDKVVCTEDEKVEIYLAMEKGDNWTKLDIIQWKLDQARDELMKLQNYVDIEQRGKYSDIQKARIQELNKRIGELESHKTELFKQLKEKR